MSITLQQAHDIFDHLHEVVWLATADWRKMLYVNPAFERICGLDRAVLLSGPRTYAEAMLEIVFPEDRAFVRAEMSQPLETPREFEYRIVRGDGAVRWIRGRRRPVRDAAGRVVQFVGLAEDVTHLKEAELEQRRLLEELKNSTETLRRLREEMVTMCAWTKRIHHAGRWVSLEEFLQESLSIPVTHGMSPAATETMQKQLNMLTAGGPAAA
ncbi:MAG: PAS domain-containing protein [Opitutae bacterium]|nr:PAS domain-containing protein [Opitutae bacterium]